MKTFIQQEGLKQFYLGCLLVGLITFCFIGPSFAQHADLERYEKSLVVEIPYGDDKESLGLWSEIGTKTFGPSSYVICTDGNLYICDSINQRIQVYSKTGVYQRTAYQCPATGPNRLIAPGAIVVGDPTYVIFYNHGFKKLYQFDHNGNLLNSVAVETSIDLPFRTVDNNIYLNDCSGFRLLGTVTNGVLSMPAGGMSTSPDMGWPAKSKRRYKTFTVMYKKAGIFISEEGKKATERKKIEIAIDHPLGIQFLNEDRYGNFFIRTSRVRNIGKPVSLTEPAPPPIREIRKFDPDGVLLSVMLVDFSENIAYLMQPLRVDGDGSVFQLVPAKEGVKLYVFSQSSK